MTRESRKDIYPHHKGGKTVKKYNVALDVPEQPIPLLPTEAERVGRAGTQEYTVVGIVLALVRDSKALVQGFLDTIGATVLI